MLTAPPAPPISPASLDVGKWADLNLWTADWTPTAPNGLTFIDFFCGAGGSSIGLVAAGWTLVLGANHWPRAIETHSSNFRLADHTDEDLDRYDMRRLPPDVDMLWASVICFAAGTLILTRNGLRPIEDVKVGEQVLTHTGRWRRVTKTMRNLAPKTVTVKGQGHPGLETTPEHPFYARPSSRRWHDDVSDYRRDFEDPRWVDAIDLNGHHWAAPAVFGDPAKVPAVPGTEFDDSFWRVVGSWLARGSMPHMEATLQRWLEEHFGRDSASRTLPGWALTMSEEWRRNLLIGYAASARDRPSPVLRCATTSKQLAVGIRLLAVSLGQAPALQRDSQQWAVVWNPAAYRETVTDDKHLWAPVQSVTQARELVEVYNIAVEDDESYIADGIVVHNCTEVSPAGGKGKSHRKTKQKVRPEGQAMLGLTDEELDRQEEMEARRQEGYERTQATAYDVLRATELWMFKAVMIENVLEFITEWKLFRWWLRAFKQLGYNIKILSINSAHVAGDDNSPAPQWRDRIYIVMVRNDFKMPRIEHRPIAWCIDCGKNVRPRQVFKDTPYTRQWGKIGKYLDQYYFVCPNTSRPHEHGPVVEPYVLPAASAIDWTNLGPTIGERKPAKGKPEGLAPNTMAKIRGAVAMARRGPAIIQVNHGPHDGRTYPADGDAMATRTVKGGDGLVCAPVMTPFLVQVGGNKRNPAHVDRPMPTRMQKDTDALCTPAGASAMVEDPYIIELRGGGSDFRPALHPAGTVSAQGNHHAALSSPLWRPPEEGFGLVVPYRRGKAKTTDDPLHTVAVKESAALATAEHPLIDVRAFRYRMLTADEHLLAQRFPRRYLVTGSPGERTMQAGNAVSSNVPQWLGRLVAAAIAR